MTEIEYDETATEPQTRETLWRSVLMAAVEDALTGAQLGSTKQAKVSATYEARAYIVTPNSDFNEVCALAGLDPVAVRERLIPQIAAAPKPEQLFAIRKRRKSHRTAGQRKPRGSSKKTEGRAA